MTALDWRKDKWSSHEAWVANVEIGEKSHGYRIYDWKGEWTCTGLRDITTAVGNFQELKDACQADLDVRERLQRWEIYMETHEPPEA